MITYETKHRTYPYDFYFRVFDDKEKIVTIELEEEWGVSSLPCKEWEEGLADAIIRAKEFVDPANLLFAVFSHNMISNRRLLVQKLNEFNKKSK